VYPQRFFLEMWGEICFIISFGTVHEKKGFHYFGVTGTSSSPEEKGLGKKKAMKLKKTPESAGRIVESGENLLGWGKKRREGGQSCCSSRGGQEWKGK